MGYPSWRSKILIFIIYFSNHDHILNYVDYTGKSNPAYSGGWSCNECGKYGPGNQKNWHCEKCSFDVCRECLEYDG